MVRTLVIEDDDITLDVTRRFLEHFGHEVEVAPDGLVGLKKAAAGPFDLVITDIVMPEQEGLQTIAELRRRNLATCIIAISGGGTQIGAQDALSLARKFGADYSIQKPFTMEQLKAIIHEALSGATESAG